MSAGCWDLHLNSSDTACLNKTHRSRQLLLLLCTEQRAQSRWGLCSTQQHRIYVEWPALRGLQRHGVSWEQGLVVVWAVLGHRWAPWFYRSPATWVILWFKRCHSSKKPQSLADTVVQEVTLSLLLPPHRSQTFLQGHLGISSSRGARAGPSVLYVIRQVSMALPLPLLSLPGPQLHPHHVPTLPEAVCRMGARSPVLQRMVWHLLCLPSRFSQMEIARKMFKPAHTEPPKSKYFTKFSAFHWNFVLKWNKQTKNLAESKHLVSVFSEERKPSCSILKKLFTAEIQKIAKSSRKQIKKSKSLGEGSSFQIFF